MERLTTRDTEGTYFITPIGNSLSAPELRLETVQVLLDRIADYEDAEEAGILVRIPCKIGTPCFCVGYNEVYSSVFCYNNIPYFGKTVFLTREEAEAALAKEG